MEEPNDVNVLNELSADLFPGGDEFKPLTRAAYYGFATAGSLLTFFASLMIVIEVVTSSLWSLSATLIVMTCGVISVTHIVQIARKPIGLRLATWLVFTASVGVQITEVWSVISDPKARAVFAGSSLVGGVWLLAVRGMLSGFGRRLSERGVLLQAMAAVIAWAPLTLLLSMLYF